MLLVIWLVLLLVPLLVFELHLLGILLVVLILVFDVKHNGNPRFYYLVVVLQVEAVAEAMAVADYLE